MRRKNGMRDWIRTYIKKQPYNPLLTEFERNELLIDDFNDWFKRDSTLSLSVSRLSPNRLRMICKGVYMGGDITLRLDKNASEEQILTGLEAFKNDIFTVGREFKVFYPEKDITFLRYIQETNLSCNIVYRVGIEEKTVNYRPCGYPLAEALHDYLLQEADGQVISGTFVVGDRKFIQLLNENRGKKVHVAIEPFRTVRGIS